MSELPADAADSSGGRYAAATDKEEFLTALASLRQQINNLDAEVIQLLGRRMAVAEKIGQYKKENDITILQTNRLNEILERSKRQGEQVGLTPDFIERYMEAVHLESVLRQEKVMKG
ncbi:MAG: hypothetical protein EOO40_08960 [Deltaproteobacteria bacterium]|nr:MAG: hypothetical protein EOO40_08960 [Deltaproteobacteria bacterium]